MNPSIERTELTLAINEVDAALDYGLSARQSKLILQEVRAAVKSWRKEAGRLRIPRSEQDLMAPAFQH